MFTPHHVSCVTCHVSHVTCHVSPVTCKKKKLFFVNIYIYIYIYIFLNKKKWKKWWRYSVEGLLSTGHTPSSLEMAGSMDHQHVFRLFFSPSSCHRGSTVLANRKGWQVAGDLMPQEAPVNSPCFFCVSPQCGCLTSTW